MGKATRTVMAAAAAALAARLWQRSGREGQGDRLWILDQSAVTPDVPGNARHFGHAPGLTARGWRVSILASGYNHKLGRFARPVSWGRPVTRREGDAHAVWLYTTPYEQNDWRRYAGMVTFLAESLWWGMRQRRGPAAVVGSSPHLLTGLGGWLLAKWHRAPFLLEVRDLWPDTLVEMGLTNPVVIGPLRAIERLLYWQADGFVIVADHFRGVIEKRGGAGRPFHMVPNSPERAGEPEARRRRETRERLGWANACVFVYAGAFGPANGLEMLIRAAKLLPAESTAKVVLIGAGAERDRLIEEASGHERIEFMAAVPRFELAALLDAADVGVITLRKVKVFEGVRPNKLYDYLAHALPVVSNVPGEARRVLAETGAGVFVEPGDADALARAIERLAADTATREALRQRAAAHAATMPTRTDMAELLAEAVAAATTSRNDNQGTQRQCT